LNEEEDEVGRGVNAEAEGEEGAGGSIDDEEEELRGCKPRREMS